MVDLEELCELLTRSWPEAGSTDSATVVSSSTTEKMFASTDEGPTSGQHDIVHTDARAERGVLVPFELYATKHEARCDGDIYLPELLPLGGSTAFHMPWPATADTELDTPTGATPQEEEKPRIRFSDDAMRVISSCERILREQPTELNFAERTQILRDISQLKKRYTNSSQAASRSSISRHRRYSLGSEARRVLKGWVDTNMEDPYPSVAEKHQLAQQANLSIKQVNDWFTNYRKRHWDEERDAIMKAV